MRPFIRRLCIERRTSSLGNGLLAWGHGLIGGGFQTPLAAYSWPEGVPVLSKVASANAGISTGLAAKTDGSLWTWGVNSMGAQGIGFFELRPIVEVPTQVTGGHPLYYKQELGPNKEGKFFTQPEGPIGPVVKDIVAVSGAGPTRIALTSAGRVLSWGANTFGQCANGWEQNGTNLQNLWETGGEAGIWRPASSPWWVQTGAPAQAETGGAPGSCGPIGDGSGENILQNVKAISSGEGCSFFLLTNGQVWYSGKIAAFPSKKEVLYATHDPLLTEAGITNVTAIAASRGAYMVLLSTGHIRVVGMNREAMWGRGAEETTATERKVQEPEAEVGPGEFAPLTKVTAIAMGEYHCKVLKDDGTVWTWGSNREGQQGLGNPEQIENEEEEEGEERTFVAPTKRPTQIPGLTKVIAIEASGEQRGPGEFGGDVAIALKDDGTVRTWGKQVGPGVSVNPRPLLLGTLCDLTSDNKNVPVQPPVINITSVAIGPSSVYALQKPGGPIVPTVVAVSPNSKRLLVVWRSIGGPQEWRPEEAWKVRWERTEKNPETGKSEIHNSPSLKPGVEGFSESPNIDGTVTYTYETAVAPAPWKGVASEEHLVRVLGTNKTEAPKAIGGEVQTATAKKLVVTWPDPVKSEPGWHVQWQRTETFVGEHERIEKEHWNRSKELSGATRSYEIVLEDFAPPFGKGVVLKGEQIAIQILGRFEGTFGTRSVLMTVMT